MNDLKESKIKTRRVELNISRAELSRLSSVPIRTLEDWELGKRTPRDVYQLAKIAKALKCNIEDLVYVD